MCKEKCNEWVKYLLVLFTKTPKRGYLPHFMKWCNAFGGLVRSRLTKLKTSKFWSTRVHSSLRCSSDPNDNIGSPQTSGTSEAKRIIEWSTWTSVLGENFTAVRNLASTLVCRWCKQCCFNQEDFGDLSWFGICPRCLRSPWRLVELKYLFLFVFKLLRNIWHHVLPLIIVPQMRTFLVHRISQGLVGSRNLPVLETGEKRGTGYMTRLVTILVKSVGLIWI